ncbi:MAG TPA: hypothetical protein VFR23_00200 [Jiangellaceae bacterium]|nr:hypothetical protein [Jiangellaceae bacterium]
MSEVGLAEVRAAVPADVSRRPTRVLLTPKSLAFRIGTAEVKTAQRGVAQVQVGERHDRAADVRDRVADADGSDGDCLGEPLLVAPDPSVDWAALAQLNPYPGQAIKDDRLLACGDQLLDEFARHLPSCAAVLACVTAANGSRQVSGTAVATAATAFSA